MNAHCTKLYSPYNLNCLHLTFRVFFILYLSTKSAWFYRFSRDIADKTRVKTLNVRTTHEFGAQCSMQLLYILAGKVHGDIGMVFRFRSSEMQVLIIAAIKLEYLCRNKKIV